MSSPLQNPPAFIQYHEASNYDAPPTGSNIQRGLPNNPGNSAFHRVEKSDDNSELRVIEYQTLKIPYELLNKKFRNAQKTIDRESSYLQNSIKELNDLLANSRKQMMTADQLINALTSILIRLRSMKRKVYDSIQDEIDAVRACKSKLDHYVEYCHMKNLRKTFTDNNEIKEKINEWQQIRLDRLLVDHCLRSGYYETALALARSCKIENLTNIDIFLVFRDIEESLKRHETAPCLAWCHENKSKLRKLNSKLEYNIRKQEFIELIRTDQRMEAVKYAQKYFPTFEEYPGSDAILIEIPHLMGLLGTEVDTNIAEYKELFDPKRWDNLIQELKNDYNKLYQLSEQSIFSLTFRAGLSSLKTRQCYREDGYRNRECPICSEDLNRLAYSLPCAHSSQSKLICYISGEPMNEHNQPLMLPNGYVYGTKALQAMADSNNGQVICPRTKAVFNLSEAKKVFVM